MFRLLSPITMSIFMVNPPAYYMLKTMARVRHEWPVTPVGIAAKAVLGTHWDDDYINDTYPI